MPIAPMPYGDAFDDDATTDSNTVATKVYLTKDGKCVHHPWVVMRGKDPATGQKFARTECPDCLKVYERKCENLRQRKLELDRQLMALDNASSVGNPSADLSTSGESNSNGNVNGDPGGQQPQMPPQQHQAYRPPPPPHAYYGGPGGGGFPPYSYGGPPPPPHHPMYSPPPPLSSGPAPASSGSNGNSNSSSAIGGRGDGGSNHSNNNNQANISHPYAPDPYYAATYHPGPYHGPHLPPEAAAAGALPSSGGAEHAFLLRLLQDKETEMKQLRQTLQETQDRLQEQTLKAAKLETTLEQQAARHEQEQKLIRLQAESQAHEKFQAQQQEIFQKQLTMMDKWQHQQQQQQQQQPQSSVSSGAGLESIPASAVDETATSVTKTEAVSTTEEMKAAASAPPPVATASNAKSTGKNYPWSNKTTPSTPSAGSEVSYAALVEEVNKTDELEAENAKMSMMQQSMDESLFDSAGYLQQSNHSGGDPEAETATAVEALKKMSIKQQVDDDNDTEDGPDQQQQASDRFTPVYVAEDKAAAEQHANEIIQNPPADEVSLGQTVASSTYGEDRQSVKNKSLLDPYGDKGVYTGVVLRTTGMPHGLGRMIYEEDGRIYEGDWRHGRWHGWGKASFSNGDSYEGEYKFDQRHGAGIYKWSDGRIYDGTFSEDKRHGKGTFTWPDGAVYDGAFVNGQREGQGRYTFADGGQYEGTWKDGRYDGFGTCTWEDGRRYRGEWRNGMAHGRGVETYPNGNVRHEGQWIDDEPVR